MHKELLIGRIHLGKVGHIRQKDIDLDNLGHFRTGGLEDGIDVVAASLGELANVTLDQGAGGVGGNLAGDEDLAVGADSLGLKGC